MLEWVEEHRRTGGNNSSLGYPGHVSCARSHSHLFSFLLTTASRWTLLLAPFYRKEFEA